MPSQASLQPAVSQRFATQDGYHRAPEGGPPARMVTAITDGWPHPRAQDQMRHYAERVKVLREVDEGILSGQPTAVIARRTLRHVRRLIPCQRVSLVLFSPDHSSGSLVATSVAGKTRLRAGASVAPVREWLHRHLGQGQACVRDDIRRVGRAPQWLRTLAQEGIRSYMSVPIVSQGKLVGSLNLGSETPGAFGNEQVAQAREVAAELALAIHSARLLEDAQESNRRLEALSQRLLEAQERERRSIGRELHDEIGQILTSIKMILEAAKNVSSEEFNDRVTEASNRISDLLQSVRDISLDLRPSILDDLGLLPALIWHVDRFRKQTCIPVRFAHTGLRRRFRPELETAAFRIVQEALTNVARHSRATRAAVTLRTDERALHVRVSDDGLGFDAAAQAVSHSAVGLSGMQERAFLLRGSFQVQSQPGKGTRLTAHLPLNGSVQSEG